MTRLLGADAGKHRFAVLRFQKSVFAREGGELLLKHGGSAPCFPPGFPIHSMNDERKPIPEPVWCISANIVQERPYGPGGLETRRGTKHFAPGAKVYCVLFFWSGLLTSVDIVGRHRGLHRYVRMMVKHDWLTNLKVDLVYSPYVISQLTPSHAETKAEAEKAVEHLRSLIRG